jgi:hypothetical protein
MKLPSRKWRSKLVGIRPVIAEEDGRLLSAMEEELSGENSPSCAIAR